MYIVFDSHTLRGGVSKFIAKLRELGVQYDLEYGVKRVLGQGWIVRADMTEEQQDVVESLPNVSAITVDDPMIPADDPLSGCDEEYVDTRGPLEGCDEPGDPDD